jgi:hypothetical protein
MADDGGSVTSDDRIRAETNAVAACMVFVAAVAFDALNALPSTAVVDVPSSLRATSLTLLAVLAAPPVNEEVLWQQRGVAVLALLVAAWLGLHVGDVHSRVADCAYVLVGGWSTLLIFTMDSKKRWQTDFDTRGKRENVTALSNAYLLYTGIRIVRAGLEHATAVTGFTLTHDTFATRGYGVADDVVATGLVFGGSICICAAVIVLLNYDQIYAYGCASVCSVVGMLSVLAFTAAFVVQIADYARIEDLDSIFGPNACGSAVADCQAAFRARKLYVANSSPASLWAAAIGLTMLAFPHERRCRARRDYYRPQDTADLAEFQGAAGHAGLVAALSVAVAAVVVWFYADTGTVLPSIEILLLYVSIPVAWFGSSWLACGLHVAGQLLYTGSKFGEPFGFDMTYLTHWSVAASIVLLLVLTATTGISQILYDSCCSHGRFVIWIEALTAWALIALTSLQLVLTLGTLSLVSAYDGGLVVTEKGWRAHGFEWVVQHCLTFFFAAALVGGRFECFVPAVPTWSMRLVWFLVPGLLVVAWMATLAAASTSSPYNDFTTLPPLLLGVVAGIAPWVTVGTTLC